MNNLAVQLNDTLNQENPYVYEMLSELGKNLFYPKGILSQSAEAGKKATRYNATIGIATEDDGPMHFEHIQKHFVGYSPKDIYPYAPPEGKKTLREAWKNKIVKDSPSLQNKNFGLPIVTNALTHGLSVAADLFVEDQDAVILPDKYWGNYNIVFNVRRGGQLKTFELFNQDGKFNVEGLKACLMQQKEAGKAIVLLNFPNNPTGFTPSVEEVQGIVQALKEAAEAGINIVALLDDAYFGLFYEDSIKESIFGLLAGLHPRILPVKIDGATKENYVWGLRVGFLTFASESPAILNALEQKAKGIIRGTISSSSHLSQTVILESLESNEFDLEKQQKFTVMENRANKVKQVLQQEKFQDYWTYYPFNSGYFMCLKLKNVNAEKLRLHLLDEYGVGTIAINDTDLRIAFSCVEERDIEDLFELIYQGMIDLTTNQN